jgi:lactoylglutathione lyase
MKFSYVHNNINVADLEASLRFYSEALGMSEQRRVTAEDGSFIIVFVKNPESEHLLELTWLRDMDRPYNLGDNEFHMAFATDDMAAARAKHDAMGCIVFENPAMGLYFIADPDGYWSEIIPS